MITAEAVNIHTEKKYSAGLRFWHWGNALMITGSLVTVLINSTILKPWTNAALIAGELKDKGVAITEDQARPAAFALSDKIWAVHTYLGYTLVALFLFRLAIELLGLADKTMIRRMRDMARGLMPAKEAKLDRQHEKLVKTLYTLFYMMLGVMAITGMTLAMENFIKGFRPPHFIRDIHEFTMYLIIGFIIIHLAGVYLGERRRHKGIVSDMINGGEAEA